MQDHYIAILLATYNGAKYLSEQLESIAAQTFRQWHLFIHDDGSTDGTIALLKAFASRHPQQVTLLGYPAQGGACRNFLSMLERVEATYYMFADQDDVWHTDKIEKSLQAMQQAEGGQRAGEPIVVHTDLSIVDTQEQIIHESFFAFANIHPERFHSFSDYVQNVVTGSTMLFNQAAKEASLSKPYDRATMHDAWVMLCTAAHQGERVTIYEPLVDYRQHADNVLGAQDGHRFTIAYRLTHTYEMLRQITAHYRMMRSAGAITLLTFIRNKTKAFIQNNFSSQ